MIIFIIFGLIMIFLELLSTHKANISSIIVWESNSGEYNPSIWIDENGFIDIAMRKSNNTSSNYMTTLVKCILMKLYDKIIYEKQILYRGKISCDKIDMINYKPLNIPYDGYLPLKHRQFEDPRIYYHNGDQYLMTTTINFINGKRYVKQILTINEELTIDFKGIEGSYKNWNFFVDADKNLLLLTDIYPFRIRRLISKDGDLKIISEQNYYQLKDLRCTSTAVPYNEDTLLTIAHKTINNSWASYFIVFKNKYPYHVIKMSRRIYFIGARIEFASGLAKYNNSFYVSIGINDDYSFILKINHHDIEEHLFNVL